MIMEIGALIYNTNVDASKNNNFEGPTSKRKEQRE